MKTVLLTLFTNVIMRFRLLNLNSPHDSKIEPLDVTVRFKLLTSFKSWDNPKKFRVALIRPHHGIL